ncbi:hypothetical protein [Microaceticoccus formicicus]|nr:hypothetical protein VZL98_06185 [Peptoniphilaceae bacterium AMB_02]
MYRYKRQSIARLILYGESTFPICKSIDISMGIKNIVIKNR